MLKISDVYNKDGASILLKTGYAGQERHHNFRHFRHFSGLSGLGITKKMLFVKKIVDNYIE
jgi:hypothetical protein